MDELGVSKHVLGWRESLAGASDTGLVQALNREVGNSGWVAPRGSYLRELRDELDRRGVDRSAVEGLAVFPGKRPFALSGKRLVYADQALGSQICEPSC